MSNSDAIAIIGQALVKLLESNMRDIITGANSIVLCSPADVTGNVRLSIFLYQVTENSYMKNQDMVQLGLDRLQYPPLYLDLFYLLTPYSNENLISRSEEEHKILGRAMKILHDNAVLSEPLLNGELEGKDEFRISINALSLDEVNKIWSAFTNKQFKLSIGYRVGPIAIESDRIMETRRVISTKYEYNVMETMEGK